MKKKLHLLLVAMLLQVTLGMAQGAESALNFDGTDNLIQLSSPLTVGSSSHTFELWVRVPLAGTEGLSSSERVGNILGAYNSTPHFNYELYSNGSPRVYWNAGEINSTASASYDFRDNKWHHLAYVRDTANSEFRIYKDGVLIHTISSVGTDITMAVPHRIGGDNRNSGGGPSFHGDMDEIRMWDYARSEAEIRASMCSKVDTASAGLVLYYKLEEAAGLSTHDFSVSANHGVLTNMAANGDWKTSGAAIGDSSVFVYAPSMAGQTLAMGTTALGSLTIDSLQNNAAGLHLYRVNAVPNTVSGVKDLAANNTYFGVYVAEDSLLHYNARFQYSNFPLAITSEDSLKLYNREGADSTLWYDLSASRLKAIDELKFSNDSGYRNEYILGNLVGFVCQSPSALAAANVSYSSASLSWTTGGAVLWDVLIDVAGFNPANSGRLDSAVASNPYAITGLKPLTNYEFYVRDNCGSQGGSAWVGPFAFTTLAAPPCPQPTGLSVSNVGSSSVEVSFVSASNNSNIQYGPAGFTLGNGTFVDSVYASPHLLTGLNSSTNYDLYIQDSCNLVNGSAWVGPISFHTDIAVVAGAAVALEFDGDDDYIQLPNILPLGNSSHTVELWVKVPRVGEGNLVANERVGIILGSYNSSPNFNYEIHNAGTPRIYWNAAEVDVTASTEYDLRDNAWHHLAFVRDTTNAEFKIYLDGEKIVGVNSAGSAIAMVDNHRIGGDNRNADGGPSFHGQMDEIRIWDYARSEAEIRSFMCQKPVSNAGGLLYYYDLDSLNFNDGTGNGMDGSLVNFASDMWKNSGAPIGDTSIYLHDTLWAGTQLALSSNGKGLLMLDSVKGDLQGMHIYRLNDVPNSTEGIFDIGNQDVHFGVFLSEDMVTDLPSSYDLAYQYSNYPTAMANEANLKLYNRGDASVSLWTNTGASVNTTADEVKLKSLSKGRQFLLSDFVPNPCASSFDLGVQAIGVDSAQLVWTAASAGQTIEVGLRGFKPGANEAVSYTGAQSPFTVVGLNPSTVYEYYVQDSCTNGDVYWVGPFSFVTDQLCPAPSFVLQSVTDSSATFQIQSNGSDTTWVLTWGPVGFNVAFGIQSAVHGSPVVFTGLQPNTSYDFYLHAVCDTLTSYVIGPISLTTDSASSGVGQTEFALEEVAVYPNPAERYFSIEMSLGSEAQFELLSAVGELIAQGSFVGQTQVSLPADLAAGIYLVKVKTASSISLKRLRVN